MNMRLKYFTVLFMLCALYCNAQDEGNRFSSGMRIQRPQAVILRLIDSAAAFVQTDPDLAISLLQEAREQSNWQSYTLGTGRSLLEQGTAWINKGLVTEAEQALQQAIPALSASPDGKKYMPHAIAALGKLYSVKAEYETAIKYYYESIALAEKSVPEANLDYVYNNLAGVLTQIGRNTESVWAYLDKAEHSAIARKDSLLLAKVYNNMGFASNSRKTWDSSRFYFNRCLLIAQQKKVPVMEHLALTNIGITYLEQNNPKEALPYLEKANTIKAAVPSYNSNLALGALGQTYVLLGDYTKAEPILMRQYREAVAQKQSSNIRTAHYYLSQLYGAKKDYNKAYEHAAAYIEINNTLSGAEIIRNVNQEEVKFRTAEKDKDLLQKKLLIERQQRDLERKNRWIAITAGAIIIFVLLVFLVIKSYRSRQRLMKHKMDNLEQQREIERLKADTEGEERERARIARELHDGIGGLISAAQINMRTLGKEHQILKDSEIYLGTGKILEEVGMELRKTAHNMMPSVLLHRNIEEAITVFCNYIKQNKSLHFDLQFYGDFNRLPDSYKVAVYRIVQELIHNVVKHAQATSVLVQLMSQESVMSITIEDNGIGFEPKSTKGKKGQGLKNIEERVKPINGSFSIDSMPGKGTSVYIELEIPDDDQ
jgi:two-component system NarL family sensor kinase